MTLDTLSFLRQLLCTQVIAVGAPDFEEAAFRAGQALRELDAAITGVLEVQAGQTGQISHK